MCTNHAGPLARGCWATTNSCFGQSASRLHAGELRHRLFGIIRGAITTHQFLLTGLKLAPGSMQGYLQNNSMRRKTVRHTMYRNPPRDAGLSCMILLFHRVRLVRCEFDVNDSDRLGTDGFAAGFSSPVVADVHHSVKDDKGSGGGDRAELLHRAHQALMNACNESR